MRRLGLPPDELARLAAEPERLDGLTLRAVLSHLACANEPEHPQNAEQLASFRAALAQLPPAPASLAASSGIFLDPAYHGDFARPGAALYGLNPLSDRLNPMTQVVKLKGKILQIRAVDRNQTVGYGAAHRMARSGRIATIAVGYADGWFRSSGHRGTVGCAGQRAPVIGRISMDLLTIDVTGIDPALIRPGDFVDLIDEDCPPDAVAAAAGTIGYEVLTALGHRHHRLYRDGAA
jgi:alanine racemase